MTRTVSAALVFNVVSWIGASTIITLSDVDFAVVAGTLDVNGGFRVTVVTRFAVARFCIRIVYATLRGD